MTQPKGNRVAIDFNYEFHFVASVRIIRPQKSRIDLVEYFNWILSQIFLAYLDDFLSMFLKNNVYQYTHFFTKLIITIIYMKRGDTFNKNILNLN